MSFNNLRPKYCAEEAQSMLEEDFGNDESDGETISDDQPSVSSIFDISSDEEDMYWPNDVSSPSDEDEESPRNNLVQFSRNGETWNSLLSARLVRTNQSNIVRVKPGVNPVLRHKDAANIYECCKLFTENSMLKTIQAHTTRETKNEIRTSNYLWKNSKHL